MSTSKINSIDERIAEHQHKIRLLVAKRKVAVICEKQRIAKLQRKDEK